MSRRLTDNIQIGLRVREGVRQRLVREARKNHLPLNREIAGRLERSLEAETVQGLEDAVTAATARLRKAVAG